MAQQPQVIGPKPPEILTPSPSKELEDLKKENEKLKTDNRTLAGKVSELVQKPVQRPAGAQVQEPPPNIKELIWSDPEKALDYYASQKIAPLAQELVSSSAEAQKRVSQKEHAKTWEKYKDELESLEKSIDPIYLARPGGYDYLVRSIKANHIDEILEERVEELKKELASKTPLPHMETESTSSASTATTAEEAKVLEAWRQVPEEERDVAKKMGFSPKDWLEYR